MPPDARTRHFPFGKLIFALLTASILVGALGSGAILAYQGRYVDRVYPGVTVDGVDIGGLDRETARATLERGLAGYGHGTVTVKAGSATLKLPFSAANRRADVATLLDQAFLVGRTGDTVGQLTDGVRSLLHGTTLHAGVLVDEAALATAVAKAAATVDIAPVNATASSTKTGFAATPAVEGRGLDQAALVSAVAAALKDPAAADQLSVSGALTSVAPAISDADVDAAITAAGRMARDVVLTAGKDSWKIPATTVRTWITFGLDATGRYWPMVGADAPVDAIAAFAPKVKQDPVEASYLFGRGSNVVGVSAGRNGRALDAAATAPLVVAALAARTADTAPASPPPVAMALKVKQPKLTTEEARKSAPLMRKISTWTTYYPVGAHNGFGANITIPAREIDGTVVAPGATFDWWKALAPVNDASLLARGYRYGGAIINGHSAEGKAIAGGICSASTTLFNAVARAGYQIDQRYNHYYFIDRYPTGMDATVAAGSKNLVWTNDSKYPVLIRGSGSPGKVTFSLYTVAVNKRGLIGGGYLKPGRPHLTYLVANGRKVTFSSSGLGNYTLPGSPITQTTTNPRENGTVIDYPLPGFNITVWRTVWVNGKVVQRDKWYSNYTMMRLLTLVYKKK